MITHNFKNTFAKKTLLFFFFSLLTYVIPAYGQTDKLGWLYIENSHSFNSKWKLNTDLHVRSRSNFQKFGDLLVRNWIDYSITDNFDVGAGYAYLGQWNSDYSLPDSYYAENRTFQQIQLDIDLPKNSRIRQRIRLEQRFFNVPLLPNYSLRSRYALNWKKNFEPNFVAVDFLFLENELFFNMKGRSLSADNFFEQNRTYGGLGFNPFGNYEFEIGAYYQIQNNVFQTHVNSIIFQLRIKTDI